MESMLTVVGRGMMLWLPAAGRKARAVSANSLLKLMVLVAPLATACLKTKAPSAPAAAADSLTITGNVRALAGTPEAGVNVFIEAESAPAAVSDANGDFAVTLDLTALNRISAELPPERQAFCLYLEPGGSPARSGVTAAIPLSERGVKAIAAVLLQNSATVRGTAKLIGSDLALQPAAGAKVSAGRASATTGADGAFTLTNVPVGKVAMVTSMPQLTSDSQDLTMAPGEQKTLPSPVVLFPETGVQGTVILDPSGGAGDEAGHPLQRRFQPIASRAAKYLRWATDQAQLGAAPWQTIPTKFDVDFPKDGGNVLYYQFADDKQQAVTGVLQYVVVIDEFGAAKGLVIEDGSGVVTKRNVLVHLDVPKAAYRVRFAETKDDLPGAPLLQPQAAMQYTFLLQRDPMSGLAQGYGQRTLFMQYQDALGGFSPTYSATVSINLFAPATSDIFQINGGTPISNERLVGLGISVPPNAAQMRIFEALVNAPGTNPILATAANPTDTNNKTRATADLWLAVQPTSFYTFPSSGLKTIYLQFRTADNVLSPVYQQQIRIEPFADAAVGFTINDGAPTTSSPYLNIKIVPPAGARQFALFEGDSITTSITEDFSVPTGLVSAGATNAVTVTPVWMGLTPRTTYIVTSPGAHNIRLKFRDADGTESPVYQQTIVVDPFPSPVGGFVINDGGPLALTSLLTLHITPPLNATSMAASVDFTPDPLDGNWVDVAPTATVKLERTGAHTIYLRFKTKDGSGIMTYSPAVAAAILYDPFPINGEGLIINNGDKTVVGQDVTLTFKTTPNVTQFRVADSPDDLKNHAYQAMVPNFAYKLPAGSGDHRVYVQYATAGGLESPAYFATIAN